MAANLMTTFNETMSKIEREMCNLRAENSLLRRAQEQQRERFEELLISWRKLRAFVKVLQLMFNPLVDVWMILKTYLKGIISGLRVLQRAAEKIGSKMKSM